MLVWRNLGAVHKLRMPPISVNPHHFWILYTLHYTFCCLSVMFTSQDKNANVPSPCFFYIFIFPLPIVFLCDYGFMFVKFCLPDLSRASKNFILRVWGTSIYLKKKKKFFMLQGRKWGQFLIFLFGSSLCMKFFFCIYFHLRRWI